MSAYAAGGGVDGRLGTARTDSSVLADLSRDVQRELGTLISRPKLTEKLLAKPPFRFLLDIVAGVAAATGLLRDVFTPTELDSTSHERDKAEKVAFLTRLIAAVAAASGRSLDARPAKIVAGQEPEATCRLLLVSECAIAPFRRLKRTWCTLARDVLAAQALAAAARRNIDARSLAPRRTDAVPSLSTTSTRRGASDAAPVRPAVNAANTPPDTSAASRVPSSSSASDVRFRKARELGATGDAKAAIELLQSLIAKPRLSEALLARPPFRFLHDVVSAVTAATGWGRGLFNGDELEAAALVSRESRAEYLRKLVLCIGVHLFTHVAADPAALVAGREAPATVNELLELLAMAAKSDRPSDAAVARVLAGELQPSPDGTRVTPIAVSAALDAHAPAKPGQLRNVSLAANTTMGTGGEQRPTLTSAVSEAGTLQTGSGAAASTSVPVGAPNNALQASGQIGLASVLPADARITRMPGAPRSPAALAPYSAASRDETQSSERGSELEDGSILSKDRSLADQLSQQLYPRDGVSALGGKHTRDILDAPSLGNKQLTGDGVAVPQNEVAAAATLALCEDVQALCGTGAAASIALELLPDDSADIASEFVEWRRALESNCAYSDRGCGSPMKVEHAPATNCALRPANGTQHGRNLPSIAAAGAMLAEERRETSRVLESAMFELAVAMSDHGAAEARVASLRADLSAAEARVQRIFDGAPVTNMAPVAISPGGIRPSV